MTTAVALDALDLAALLCSRVCHDLISPTGAIVNGLEVLDEKDSDQETRNFALDLIRKSARTASARLQFCRLAFGAAGSAGAQIDLGDAHDMAVPSSKTKTKLAWNLPRMLLPKNSGEVAAQHADHLRARRSPRGGMIVVDPIGAGRNGIRLAATGLNARIPHCPVPPCSRCF
jgi:histidine phosphotransferase ChpT